MTHRPKLIATDLDGTIVPHYGAISQRTVDAFTQAHEMGVEVFFATGRPPRWMRDIDATFAFGSAICCNGAMLYDLKSDTVLEEWGISIDAQIEAVKKLRVAIPQISFAVESSDYFHREKGYIAHYDVGLDEIGQDLIEKAMKSPALKLMARCTNQELTSDEMMHLATEAVGDLVTITHSNPNESHLEISAIGVSKGTTLAIMAGRLGIEAKDCVSFGDNPNDFSMLQWCGRSYAMADGHPDGKKYAKGVAPAHTADGVAIILEELLQLPA